MAMYVVSDIHLYMFTRVVSYEKSHIRKFVIHILAVTALSEDIFDIPHNQCALILLTDRTNEYIETLDIKKLVVDILDVEDKTHPRAFNRAHARMIISFLRRLPK